MCGDVEDYSGTGMGGYFEMGVGGPPLNGTSDGFPGHGGGNSGGGWTIDDLLIDTAQRANPWENGYLDNSLSPEEFFAQMGVEYNGTTSFADDIDWDGVSLDLVTIAAASGAFVFSGIAAGVSGAVAAGANALEDLMELQQQEQKRGRRGR